MDPITGGTIRSAINVTVQAGLAYPAVYENSQVEVPAIKLYEKTHDKMPNLIRIAGMGKMEGQVARMVSPAYQSGRLKFGTMASEADGQTCLAK